MAFATQNVKYENAGSMNVLVGEFTASEGDAEGSIAVAGVRVYFANFYEQTSETSMQVSFPFDITVSGNISTITVNSGSQAVTDGRFFVVFK